MSAFSPSPPFLHRSDVKCWIRKMENADVSSPLSPSLCTFSERFRVQVLRGKSLALDRIPLLLVYPFSGSQTKGFDWSRDTAASICSPCIDVDPPRNLCGRRMGKFRENSEKTNAPPPVLPYLFCLELFTNFAFNLPTHLLFFHSSLSIGIRVPMLFY